MSHSGGRVVHSGFRVMGELELPLTPTAKVAHTTFLPHLTSWEPLFLHGHDHPPDPPDHPPDHPPRVPTPPSFLTLEPPGSHQVPLFLHGHDHPPVSLSILRSSPKPKAVTSLLCTTFPSVQEGFQAYLLREPFKNYLADFFR